MFRLSRLEDGKRKSFLGRGRRLGRTTSARFQLLICQGVKKRDGDMKENLKLPRDLIMANQKYDAKHCVPVSFHFASNMNMSHLI